MFSPRELRAKHRRCAHGTATRAEPIGPVRSKRALGVDPRRVLSLVSPRPQGSRPLRRAPMKTITCVLAAGLLATVAGSAWAQRPAAEKPAMSFFVTSVGLGKGA